MSGHARTVRPEEARRALVSHLGLASFEKRTGVEGIREVLGRLRCIQLDPLDVIGQNADLVVIARVRGVQRGDVHRALYPGFAFEHFAKERCILPASAFPYYREQAVETPWWRHSERMKRLDVGLVADVLAEIEERGPISARKLTPRGQVTPLDWSGWKSTSSATKLAVEVLWTRCQIVVAGRLGKEKVYDVPRRALGEQAALPPALDFSRWAVLERVAAAGLLPRNAGPHWSMLSQVRTSALPDDLVAEGLLEEIVIDGAKKRYLATRGFFDRKPTPPDAAMRILGPLDPLLWDRGLVRAAFGFDYIWEVYKPASERRWGWYVCPLYHRGRLVGRIEASVQGTTLVVDRLWREPKAATGQAKKELDEKALGAALERHAEACGCVAVRRGRR